MLACCARLSTVQLDELPIVKLIEQYSRPATLFYLDPPYLDEGGRPIGGYRRVMSQADHVRMLDASIVTDLNCYDGVGQSAMDGRWIL